MVWNHESHLNSIKFISYTVQNQRGNNINSYRGDQRKKVEGAESLLAPPLLSPCEPILGVRMKGLRRALMAELLPPPPHQAAGHLLDIQQQLQDPSRHPRAVYPGFQQPLLLNPVPSSINHHCSSKHICSRQPSRLCSSNLFQLQLQQNLPHQQLQSSPLLLLLPQQFSNPPSNPTNMCQCRGSHRLQAYPLKTQSQMRSLLKHPLSRTPQMCQQW